MAENRNENMAPLPTPTPSKIRALAFGVLLLVSGVIIGSGLTIMTLRANAARVEDDPGWLTHRAAMRLERELDLTEEQAGQVQAIFELHRERIHTLRTEQHQNARELFQDLQSEIAEVLTPEQAEQWRERIQRERQRVLPDGPRRGERGGPGMRGPRHDGRPPHDGAPRHDAPPPDGFQPNGPPPDGFGGDRPPRRDGFRGDRPPPPADPPQ